MTQRHGTYLHILFTALTLLLAFTADAYKVSSVTGTVKVSSGGKITNAVVGDEIAKDAQLSISAGSVIKILDESTNKEYQSVSSGLMTVGELIASATQRASDNASQVNSILNIASGGKTAELSYVHRDKGMVTRRLNLDETEAGEKIAPEALARLISNAVYFGKETADPALDFTGYGNVPAISSAEMAGTGYILHNNTDTPVYFNVLKLSGIIELEADISPLGQPGSLCILPAGHTIQHMQPCQLPFGEKHVLVASPYSFDIDAVLESLKQIISDRERLTEITDTTLPVFIRLI